METTTDKKHKKIDLEDLLSVKLFLDDISLLIRNDYMKEELIKKYDNAYQIIYEALNN